MVETRYEIRHITCYSCNQASKFITPSQSQVPPNPLFNLHPLPHYLVQRYREINFMRTNPIFCCFCKGVLVPAILRKIIPNNFQIPKVKSSKNDLSVRHCSCLLLFAVLVWNKRCIWDALFGGNAQITWFSQKRCPIKLMSEFKYDISVNTSQTIH